MSDIRPALSADGWKDRRARRALEVVEWLPGEVAIQGASGGVATSEPATLHAIAALALHGQPFGFTWEMVDAIRHAADWLEAEGVVFRDDDVAQALAAADRIEALLPPRQDTP